MAVRLGGGQEEGQQDVGGTCERMRVAVRLRLQALPLPPTPSSHLSRAGGRWLAPWERHSPYHTPARLPGNWDGVVTPRRLEPGRCFPFLAAPSLSLEVVEAFGFPPQRYHTAHTSPSPASSPAVSRQTCLGFTPGAQAGLLSSLILGKSSSGELGTSTGDQMVDPGGPPKVGKGRLQSRSPLDNFGMGHRWGLGRGLGPAFGFTHR